MEFNYAAPIYRYERLVDIWIDLFLSAKEFRKSNYPRAEFLLERVLQSLCQLAPDVDLDEPWARCLSNLAAVLLAMGRLDEAEDCAFEGLALCDESWEPEVDDVRDCLLNILTDLYKKIGCLTEGEQRFLSIPRWEGVQARPLTCTSWSNAEIKRQAKVIAGTFWSTNDWPGQ